MNEKGCFAAEQAVIGALMLDKTVWPQIADILSGEDFWDWRHVLAFETIKALIAADQPTDLVTVCQWLQKTGALDAVGGLAYLGAIVRDTPTAANVRQYAKLVLENAPPKATG